MQIPCIYGSLWGSIFCEGECKCSEYSAHCKYHISICACDVKGDFDIEESIAETERLFEHSISLEPDGVASRVEYALFLQCEERFEEAVRIAKLAFDIVVEKNDFKSGHYFGIGEESRVDGNMSRLIGYLMYGLVVKSLDSRSRGPVLKTTGWLQGWLSLSSFRGR